MCVVTAAVVSLAGAAPAAASAGPHIPLVTAGILGSIFGSIGHAVLGAFSWTIGLASKFILTTIGALVRMLIPRSWANKGVAIMEWIVAVPNYAGTVTTPAGRTVYGFGGINALRDLFTWIGVGLLPLTLLYGTTRAMLGERGHVAVPIARVFAIAAVLVSYPYWWTEAAAMTDTVTHMVLTLPRVANGLHQLMLYAVDGVALGGWQLVDLALMAVVAIELLSLIFLKVVIILLGALLYATGPITIGLVATESGAAIARAWVSAVVDADRAAGRVGDAVRGRRAARRRRRHRRPADRRPQLGRLAARRGAARGRWRRVAVGVPAGRARGDGSACACSSAVCSRSAIAARRAPDAGWRQRTSSSADSLRRFGASVSRAAGGAAGQLAAAGPGGAAVVRAGRAVGYVGRHGALGTAAAGGRAAAALRRPRRRGYSWVGRAQAPSPCAWQKPEPPAGMPARMAASPHPPQTVTRSARTVPATRSSRGSDRHQGNRMTPAGAATLGDRCERKADRSSVDLDQRIPSRLTLRLRDRPQASRAALSHEPPARPAQPADAAAEVHATTTRAETGPGGGSDDADVAAPQRSRALLRADVARVGRARSRRRDPLRRDPRLPAGRARDRDRRRARAGVRRQRRAGPAGADDRTGPIPAGALPLPPCSQAARAADTARQVRARPRRRPGAGGEARARARRSRRMTGSLADLLPVSVLEPDGLIVTTAGRYVRLIECERVPNTVTADPVTLAAIERAYANVCRAIPDHQADRRLRADRSRPDRRGARGRPGARPGGRGRRSRRRSSRRSPSLAQRLLEATTQTVLAAAGAEQPAVAARWWVAVPYSPRLESPREQLRSLAARSRGRTLWSAHREAAIESARADRHRSRLRCARAGIETYPLDGTQTLALLWERLHPATDTECDLDRLAAACQVAAATTIEEAAARVTGSCSRPATAASAGSTPARTRAGCATPTGRSRRSCTSASPPLTPTPSWLSHLLCCPLPATLAVHITVGRPRVASRRASAAGGSGFAPRCSTRSAATGSSAPTSRKRSRRPQRSTPSSPREIGATVYRVGIYCSIRDPHGRLERFKRTVKQTAREFHALTNARVIRGRRLCLPGFTSTLPLGVDALRATRSYAQRNIAHCVALTSSRCGSPDGVIVGTADPGGNDRARRPVRPASIRDG